MVLGMHRSGTSLVAGALREAGVYAGEDGELMAARRDNPRGFHERVDVVRLNDSLLEAAGGNWFSPVSTRWAIAPAMLRERDRIVAALASRGNWLIKDPRMALTWPLWREALGEAIRLFVCRNPLAVAASLRQRERFPLEYGLALWERYNRELLSALAGDGFVAVSHDALAASPESELRALFARLAAAGLRLRAPGAEVVFDSALARKRRVRGADRAALSASQRELAALCDSLCRTREPSRAFSLPAADHSLKRRLADNAAAFAALPEAHGLRERLASATGERDSLHGRYLSLRDEHSSLAEAHRAATQALQELRDEHSALAEAHRAAAQALQELRARLGESYGKLLAYSDSLPGRLGALAAGAYKWLSLRPRRNTALDDVLGEARRHLDERGGAPRQAAAPRWLLLWRVLRHVAGHPASGLRGFSRARLRRALAVFLSAERGDLANWVAQRFPSAPGGPPRPARPRLDSALDTLELEFPVCAAPRVSIVVPVHNHYRMTMHCLRSVLEHSGDVDYELILADDASDDRTASIGERVRNIRISRARRNGGFLRNCNRAAAAARGEALLFLNNDAAVTAGWLSALLETLWRADNIGIVGAQLRFGNGLLQEAGGIVWRDGSGWNFGRMDRADKPEYSFLREADYVSGACLLIRAGLWRRLGGFDPRYAPAYYEDTDLAFAARAAGYRVLYQPAAVVYHFEGMSHGTDLADGVKRHQVANQARFREKWAAQLAREQFPNGEKLFLARERGRGRRCVLVIDHYVPSYDKDAGSRSTWMYLQLLVELGYKVKFIGANFFPHQPYTRELQQMGVEVLVGEHFARGARRWLRDNAAHIHVAYVHRPHVAEQFIDMLQAMRPRPRLIYFGHDLHYLRKRRELALTGEAGAAREAERWRQRESALFPRFDRVYYPSQVEVDEILGQQPEVAARAIPLYALAETGARAPAAGERAGLLFVGGFDHHPNVDAMLWFVGEALPLLRRARPDTRLDIVGSSPPARIRALAAPGIAVHGQVSDERLRELYARAAVACVPLRYGAGVKGKVIEALQHGIALVTTPSGAEGLPEAASVMRIAEGAEDFAGACLEALAGDARTRAMQARYGEYLRRNFGRARAAAIIREDFGEPLLDGA